MAMATAQAILYLVAVALLALAAVGVTASRASLPLIAGACTLLAYSLPAISAGL